MGNRYLFRTRLDHRVAWSWLQTRSDLDAAARREKCSTYYDGTNRRRRYVHANGQPGGWYVGVHA